MTFADPFLTRIINWLHDPFIWIILLGLCYIFIFSHFENKNERKMKEYLKNGGEVIFLPGVSIKHLSRFIGTRRNWSKADVYFAPHSIFVFGGGGKTTVHAQYYANQTSPPQKFVWRENNFIPIEELFWDNDNLHICYVAPAWHRAKCTLILKNIKGKPEAQAIQQLLSNAFSIRQNGK